MSSFSKSLLLFTLNWLDAQLTLVWVRHGLATEGNPLMADLLDASELSFLLVKVFVGLFAACVLYRWAHLKVARRGIKVALGVYAGVMCVHLATGAAALGWHAPAQALAFLLSVPNAVFTLLV